MSPAARTQSCNIFCLGLLWTCVWRRSGGQGQGWQCDVGNRRVWIWGGVRTAAREAEQTEGAEYADGTETEMDN